MAIEETPRSHQDPEPESHDKFNKLEIEASQESPRCVLDIPITGGSSSVSETITNEDSYARKEVNPGSPFKGLLNTMKKKTGVKLFSASTFALVSSYDMYAKTLKKKLARIRSAEDCIDCGFLPINKPSWRNFRYAELEAATNNFSDAMLVGKGGHAQVYKGCLPDGTIVAVKRLTKVFEKEEEDERSADFLSELGIIAHVDHQHTARLIGFGVEGGLFLILQFSPHGSVASCLQGENEALDWKTRYKVAVGVAWDIKASNILLAEDYEPMVTSYATNFLPPL